MTLKVLINTTRVGTITHVAGGTYDTVLSAWEIPGIEDGGGRLVDATPEILRAAALATKLHEQGAATDLLDTIMLAQAQRASTTDYDDTLVAPPLGAATIQAALDILKLTIGPTVGTLVSCDVSALSDGLFGYAIGNETLAKTDAASVATSICVGAHVGISDKVLVSGLVQNAQFAATSPTPAVGSFAFLSRADAEPLGAAAGKLMPEGPGVGVAAPIGVVIGVDVMAFPTTHIARVVFQPRDVLIRA
jgi:hypothetical protein